MLLNCRLNSIQVNTSQALLLIQHILEPLAHFVEILLQYEAGYEKIFVRPWEEYCY